MSDKKTHFFYNPAYQNVKELADKLVRDMGQTDIEDADVVVSIGGDGKLLEAFRNAARPGQTFYGITSPQGESVGYWTDHHVHDAEDLKASLDKAEEVELIPLEFTLTFTNGNTFTGYAFSDVAVERESGQSVWINLKAEFQKESIGPIHMMGDGFIVSTAYGSTGSNRSYHGPATDVRNQVMICTGKGIYKPTGIAPIVASLDTKLKMDFDAVEDKRPVRIDYDGLSISRDKDGSPVASMKVRSAPEKALKLMITRDTGMRAFAALKP